MPGGRNATSTIAQPVGSQTKPSILTRAALAVRQVFFTSADLQEPERLYRVLHAIQQNISVVFRALATNPTLSGNIITGIVFAAGTPQYIAHGLGRAYRGWYPVRARGHACDLVETTLPAGTTAAQFLPLVSAAGGTFDVLIY